MTPQTTPAETNKRIVRQFYDLAFNQRKPPEAAAKYMGKTCVQHNLMARDGPEAFARAISGWLSTLPQLKVDFKRFVAEGDLVAVHSHFTPSPGQRGMAVMDIFRVQDGKVVEHWDALQEVPENSANGNTMF